MLDIISNIIFYLMIAVLALGFPAIIYLSKKNKDGQNSMIEKKKNDKQGKNAQEFAEIKDIKDGIIIMEDNRYSMILEVSGFINFMLLSGSEQEKMEASFRSLMGSINFPVQFYSQTRLLDLSKEIEGMRARLNQLNEKMKEYAGELIGYLNKLQSTKTILVRNNYIVLSCIASSYEEALRELTRRKEIIEMEVNKWLNCNMLNTPQVMEVLQIFMNKEKALSNKIEDALNLGHYDYVVRSVGINEIIGKA
ncbi:MAG: hypothetical protein ACPLRZ_11355 [Thermovenabulum sp.]|uniref:hypothetical protein n=1 Tax=Thermovenabulum sp. TaxID=3100335 RepID=UPI003C7DED0E